MTKEPNSGGLPTIRKKYTPAFKAECVRQVATGARQSDVARAQGISPALLGRWQRQALEAAVPSFSRPGNPYDNALPGTTQAEAGWSTLKTELLPDGTTFAPLEEARLEVAHYFDTYFNLDRRHSVLGYRSPHQFEQDLKTNLSWLTVRFYWTTPMLPTPERHIGSRRTQYKILRFTGCQVTEKSVSPLG